jgi:DNA-binding XRE family transcriptional regulator
VVHDQVLPDVTHGDLHRDDLAALVRRFRLAAGLTQEELAERSSMSVRAISNIERGRTAAPYRRSVRMLADALGLQNQQARIQLLDAARRRGRWVGEVDRSESQPPGWRPAPRPFVVPRQLPAPPTGFVGRDAEQKVLSAVLDNAAVGATVVIFAIGGTAGLGKTALALHWAHQVASRFPDGQLYADLRGFSHGAAADPAVVLRGFLDALGIVPERIPPSLESIAALYRSVLAGQRVLVVLDNAHDEQQVRPLLPGSPGCVAVVTSRRRLSGLIAVEGAFPVTVDLLSADEAHALLASRLGSARIAAEPDAVCELIEQCARLPLALAVVAARAAGHPRLPLAAIAAELRNARSQFDALDGGDARPYARAAELLHDEDGGHPVPPLATRRSQDDQGTGG